MTKIAFFNPYHNGDLLHSKPFVRDVISVFGKENVYYFHKCSPKVIADLGILSGRINGLNHMTKWWYNKDHDMFFINTWVCAHWIPVEGKENVLEGEVTLRFNMYMWENIYKELNQTFSTNLKLGPIENYLPYVDYKAYDVTNVEHFIKENPQVKLLFCNGPAKSGQSKYNGDMKEIIVKNAEKYPDRLFLVTYPIDSNLANIIHTSNITKINESDLNEISYLSRFCKLIVGRNSGPFCFSATGENIMDPNKVIYAFGNHIEYDFSIGIESRVNYIFEEYTTYENLDSQLSEIIDNL